MTKKEAHALAIKQVYSALVELLGAEWMVTHDWGGDRDGVLERAKQAQLYYQKVVIDGDPKARQ
jgi:hypothetical protein